MMDIQNYTDLVRLRTQRMPPRELRLNFGIDRANRIQKINEAIQECGCEFGAIALCTGIILTPILFIFGDLPLKTGALCALALWVSAAAVGKAIGLLLANQKYYRQLDLLLEELLDKDGPDIPDNLRLNTLTHEDQ